MEILDQETPVIRYASFGDRLWAIFIDSIVLFPICGLFLLLSLGFLAPVVITWLYFALMESGSRQATFGKRFAGIIVTDMYGQRISFWQGLGRYFIRYISFGLFFVGLFLIFFTEKRQSLHDLVTGTLVVKAM